MSGHRSTACTAKTHWTTSKTTGTAGKTNQDGNRGWNGMNIKNTAYKTHLAGWGDGSEGKVLTHKNPSSDS